MAWRWSEGQPPRGERAGGREGAASSSVAPYRLCVCVCLSQVRRNAARTCSRHVPSRDSPPLFRHGRNSFLFSQHFRGRSRRKYHSPAKTNEIRGRHFLLEISITRFERTDRVCWCLGWLPAQGREGGIDRASSPRGASPTTAAPLSRVRRRQACCRKKRPCLRFASPLTNPSIGRARASSRSIRHLQATVLVAWEDPSRAESRVGEGVPR